MTNNYCHPSYEEIKNIEDELNDNKSINQIAKELNKAYSTILREIDRNIVYSKNNNFNKYRNNNYDKNLSCDKLSNKPYVCNECKSRSD